MVPALYAGGWIDWGGYVGSIEDYWNSPDGESIFISIVWVCGEVDVVHVFCWLRCEGGGMSECVIW